MKLLCFTDMHGSAKALKILQKLVKSKNPDYIICAGDFTVFEQNIESILKTFNQFKIPLLIIPGNHESGERLRELCKRYDNIIYINKGVLKTKDVIFIGNEGNGFSIDDPPFTRWGKKALKDIKKKDRKDKRVVLITHAPPYGTTTDLILEDHCGNKSVRQFIERLQPHLAVCGHLHECSGNHDKIGNTVVLNPGPYGKIVIL